MIKSWTGIMSLETKGHDSMALSTVRTPRTADGVIDQRQRRTRIPADPGTLIDARSRKKSLPDRRFSDILVPRPFLDITSGGRTNKYCSALKMESRRSFFVFILLRFWAWGTATAMIVGFLIGIGFFDRIPIAPLVGFAILGIVTSFFEFDSIPRKIEIGERKLILIDPSGAELLSSEFGVRRFLWLTRVVTCRNRRVLNIPLEAYKSTSELTKIARGRLPKRAEQNAAGQPATRHESK